MLQWSTQTASSTFYLYFKFPEFSRFSTLSETHLNAVLDLKQTSSSVSTLTLVCFLARAPAATRPPLDTPPFCKLIAEPRTYAQTDVSSHNYKLLHGQAPAYHQLVSWSLTSLFSTNMAISEKKGQGWKVIRTQ